MSSGAAASAAAGRQVSVVCLHVVCEHYNPAEFACTRSAGQTQPVCCWANSTLLQLTLGNLPTANSLAALTLRTGPAGQGAAHGGVGNRSVLACCNVPWTAAVCTHLPPRHPPQHVPLQLPNCSSGRQHRTGCQLVRQTGRPCCCPASGPASLALPAAGRLLLPAPVASLPALAARAPPVGVVQQQSNVRWCGHAVLVSVLRCCCCSPVVVACRQVEARGVGG
jgi:hypothetical protein